MIALAPRRTRARLSRHEVQEVLRGCLAEPVPPEQSARLGGLVAGRDLSQLLAAARRHRVMPLLHAALAGTEAGSSPAGRQLAAAARDALANHVRTLADLREVGRVLAAADVDWVVFKGPVLAGAVYARPDLRSYGDLDLLVPRRQFPDAVRALSAARQVLLDRNWDLISADQRGQLHFRLRFGTPADVHWHLVTRAGTWGTLAVPGEEVLERARSVSLGPLQVRTFDPVDGLLHLCIHAGLGGADVLLLLKDVQRWVETQQPAWDQVVQRAHSWKAAALVGLVLHRARSAAGADVPDGVVPALLPAGFPRMLVEATGRLWPAWRPQGAPVPVTLALRSLRQDAGSSAQALVRDARQRGRLRGTRADGSDAADAAVLVPSERTATQESFLRWVAGHSAAGAAGAAPGR